jgi:hypothetical protein
VPAGAPPNMSALQNFAGIPQSTNSSSLPAAIRASALCARRPRAADGCRDAVCFQVSRDRVQARIVTEFASRLLNRQSLVRRVIRQPGARLCRCLSRRPAIWRRPPGGNRDRQRSCSPPSDVDGAESIRCVLASTPPIQKPLGNHGSLDRRIPRVLIVSFWYS